MSNKIIKVIKIIDEYNIVINAGSLDGIKEDDLLEIYVKGDSVIDPETQEDLGTLDLIKATLLVKKAYDKMSVCGNQSSSKKSLLNPLNDLMYQHTYDKLNINFNEIDIGFPDADTTIHIGDLVRKKK